MRFCEILGCREQVLPVPNKDKKSVCTKDPFWVSYPTKDRDSNLCYFHRQYPTGLVKRVVSGATGYQRTIYFSPKAR